jgi:hypothetical protein
MTPSSRTRLATLLLAVTASGAIVTAVSAQRSAAAPAATAQMTFANFEGSLTSLAPVGAPCAIAMTKSVTNDGQDETQWTATCLDARGNPLHNIFIVANRHYPSSYCPAAYLKTCWTDAMSAAFQSTISFWDDSRGLGGGDLGNKSAWLVQAIDSKWPADIVAQFPGAYGFALNIGDLSKRLTDNFYFTEFDARRPSGKQAASHFAVQAANVRIYAQDVADGVPPTRVRAMVETMVAKLPRGAAGAAGGGTGPSGVQPGAKPGGAPTVDVGTPAFKPISSGTMTLWYGFKGAAVIENGKTAPAFQQLMTITRTKAEGFVNQINAQFALAAGVYGIAVYDLSKHGWYVMKDLTPDDQTDLLAKNFILTATSVRVKALNGPWLEYTSASGWVRLGGK